jgi:aerobic C4-dicarboxylate transport protein
VAGLALLLGVDRFMSEARAITNLIGNGVATVVVAAWEGELDRDRLAAAGVSAIYTPKDFEMSRIMRDVANLAAAHRHS